MGATTTELTGAQKLLVTAHRLKESGQKEFTDTALTVAAWQDHRPTFGAKGFEREFPCTNSTFTLLMGERGLAKRGWLVKVGPKLYSLSRQGEEEVRRILAGGESPAPKRRPLPHIRAPKELEVRLVALFQTTAFIRHESGQRRDVTYAHARLFWGLPDAAAGDEVDATLGRVSAALSEAGQLLIGDAMVLSNGQSVSAADLQNLSEVNRWLREQFARNLQRQRERRAFRRIG